MGIGTTCYNTPLIFHLLKINSEQDSSDIMDVNQHINQLILQPDHDYKWYDDQGEQEYQDNGGK